MEDGKDTKQQFPNEHKEPAKTNRPIRLTKAEKEWREDTVYDYHIWDYSIFEIWKLVTSGGPKGEDDQFYWGISQSTVKRLLKRAKLRIHSQVQTTNKTELLSESKTRWKSLISSAKKVGNMENARLCQKELDRLNGLDVITINVKVKDLRSQTDEDLLAELKALKDGNKSE